jgi:3-dehydroquinate synthase
MKLFLICPKQTLHAAFDNRVKADRTLFSRIPVRLGCNCRIVRLSKIDPDSTGLYSFRYYKGVRTLKIDVNLSTKPHSIYIGRDLFKENATFLSDHMDRGSKALIVTDRKVLETCRTMIGNSLERLSVETTKYVLQGHERDKAIETLSRCYELMYRSGLDRDSTVIALGGGVVGDLAGYAASTYMRGIKLINIPTTLLSMVDSSIGGKNGINFPWGKNVVGTFYQPSTVLVDLTFLDSLPRRVFLDGMAEVIKYSVLDGHDFLETLIERREKIIEMDNDCLHDIVSRCCEIKVRTIVADEREEGIRMTLNFGHTIGHAIEVAGSYTSYSHGQALSIGMRGAFLLSSGLGLIDQDEVSIFEKVLNSYELPLTWNIEDVKPQDLWRFMERDKKARGDRLGFVLTKGIGSVIIRDIKAEKGLILKVLDDLRE